MLHRARFALAIALAAVLLSQPFGIEAKPIPPASVAAETPAAQADMVTASDLARQGVVQLVAYAFPPGFPEPVVVGQGSGIIIDSLGHVLTNSHVLTDGEYYEVTLADGRKSDARLLGKDPATDLALLAIPLDGVLSVQLGDSDSLIVGQRVSALGYAPVLPDPPVMRSGNVVDLDSRILAGDVELDGMIQSDITLYPGDSGGPLLDEDARVVGINTAILVKRIGKSEMSYSIPINQVRPIIKDILTKNAASAAEAEATVQPARKASVDSSRSLPVSN